MVLFIMSDILKFLSQLEIQLTEEELQDIKTQNVSDEEIQEAREYIKSLGFDLKSFCTEKNEWVSKIFNAKGTREHCEKLRESAVKIQRTFKRQGPIHDLLKMLWGFGWSERDIMFCIYRLGIRGIFFRSIKTHIANHLYEYNTERLKYMELIDCTKALVFQQLQTEIRDSEKKTAEIYIRAIKRLQDSLDEVDPVDEPTKFGRVTKQIEAMQARLNSMHGIEDIRKATVETASKITVLKAMKEIDLGEKDNSNNLTQGKVIEGDVISPFSIIEGKTTTVPFQQRAS